MASKRSSFTSKALPFMGLMLFGSWGLSQFLKLPTQMKDENRRRRKEGRARFSLEQENEVRPPLAAPQASHPLSSCAHHVRMQKLMAQLATEAAEYENIRVPGPRPKGRKAAD